LDDGGFRRARLALVRALARVPDDGHAGGVSAGARADAELEPLVLLGYYLLLLMVRQSHAAV
jgi:hypothetical protein